MNSFEPKKLALIRILQILEKYSDSEHPIKHDKIVELLEKEYGLFIERKAIGRNISLLNEAGFELRQPGCSACLAMNEDKVPAGKYAVSTSNRNFEGRQGPGSRTILAGPLVAAAAAITGKITNPANV